MLTSQEAFRIYFTDAGSTVHQVSQRLEAAGLEVVKSFDLGSACASFPGNVCQHHGTSPCDCQLIVLLIYGLGSQPVSLILHSHCGKTELAWDNAPGFRPSPEGQAFIINALKRSTSQWLDLDQESSVDVK